MAAGLTERRRRAVFDAVVRECDRDLPPAELLIRVAARLRPGIACEADGWMFLDPQTLMFTGGVRPQQPRQVLARLLKNEFLHDDVIKFRALARSPSPVATLCQATGGRPERSPRYRRILAPLGCGDELRAVFRTGRTCWGAVSLVRGARDEAFSEPEAALMAAVSRHIADALRRSLMAFGAHPAGEEAPAGVLILGADDTVESQTPEAARLLGQAGNTDHERLPLPMAVYSVAHRARAMAAGCSGGPRPLARLALTAGHWLNIEAAPLDGAEGWPDRVAVVLKPAGPAHLAPLVLDLHKLTPRERQIARLLLRGDTTEQIARTLAISRHTLRQHVKAIFAKLGVASRPEFTARLTDGAMGTP